MTSLKVMNSTDLSNDPLKVTNPDPHVMTSSKYNPYEINNHLKSNHFIILQIKNCILIFIQYSIYLSILHWR